MSDYLGALTAPKCVQVIQFGDMKDQYKHNSRAIYKPTAETTLDKRIRTIKQYAIEIQATFYKYNKKRLARFLNV